VNALDLCFQEALAAGITCVATGPGSANPIAGQIAVIKTYGRCVDDMVVKAPAAMKLALGENPKTVYNEKKATPSTRMATAAIIREQLTKAREYAKKRADDKDADYDARLEALMPVVGGSLRVHIHAHRADDIFTALRLSREFGLDAAIVHCTQGHMIAEELSQNGVKAMCGPLLTDRSKPELRDSTPATHRCFVCRGSQDSHCHRPPRDSYSVFAPLCQSCGTRGDGVFPCNRSHYDSSRGDLRC
jgi:imidazolonepropionase-like amidohydrolase